MSKSGKTVEVLKVFAFNSPEGGGNPAGVVLNADGLSADQMQTIAADAGFSETAFVSKSNIAGYRFDFFTPTRRIADCGHATVAAFAIMKQLDPGLQETSKEIDAGIRKIHFEDDRVYMEQPVPVTAPMAESATEFSSLFGSLEGHVAAWIIRHDVGFAVFELNSEAALAAIKPSFAAIKTYSEANNLVGAYLFVRTPGRTVDATTRMFAPAYGIDEESATGMAAGLLSALLSGSQIRGDFVLEQGRHMKPPSPSLIYCKVRRDERQILVGGRGRREKASPAFLPA